MNLLPDGAASRCRKAVASLEAERAVSRAWSGDGSLWKVEAVPRKQIEGALGWLTIPERIAPTLSELKAFVEQARAGTERVVVLGMGGSSLAPYVFAKTFGAKPGYPQVEVLDSTEPSAVEATAARSDPSRTIFIVSSKSGTTLEPNIFFDFFFEHATRELAGRAGERFVVITDPGSALEREAQKRRVRRIFAGDPQIGGRYSALSNFGLVPAAFLGVDVAALVARAQTMAEACRAAGPQNPGLLLGAAIGAEALAGRDKLTFSIGPPADRFGMWLEQLIAESTGKEGKGILPVEGEALGKPEVYGGDRFFVRYDTRGREDVAIGARISDLAEHGHSAASMILADPLDLGAEMFRWEFATAIAGKVLGINPFDQPNVQEAKDRTSAILGGATRLSEAEEPSDAPAVDEEGLTQLLASIRPDDYFAITAYVDDTPETEAALQSIRIQVRNTRRVATTIGYGPRFQHSTGQLHKGGPPTGVFLQITRTPSERAPIPGKPYDFAQVIAAQAEGDLASLQSRGRRVLRVALGKDVAAGLQELAGAVHRALRA
ncbi:MAG TPA: glucose-6-phosphate isomerase [Thermoanaerobaculia bacterium]